MSSSKNRTSQLGLLIFVCFCFAATGAAGLIYEVIWNRVLALHMGNTSYSLATLLAVFMGGLAIGAWAGGRWAPSGRRGLAVYAFLEIGTGLYCVSLPILFVAVKPIFGWIYQNHYLNFTVFNLMQLAIAGGLLLLPTIMMGATLPILVRAMASEIENIGARVGLLYAVNALGAAAGVLLTGFVFLPALGVNSAYRIAVTINLVVGLTVGLLYFARRGGRVPMAVATDEPGERFVNENLSYADGRASDRRLLLGAYAVCGFAAMVLQVNWTRSLTMIFGSSTYAFAIITGAFILGLSIGSWQMAWIGLRRWGRIAMGGIAAIVGLAGVYTVGVLANLPVDFSIDVVNARFFGALEWARFRSAFLLFLLPTLGMGALFPLVTGYLSSRDIGAARAVGDAYTVNTLGTIVGALTAGFILIPWIGIRNGILMASGLYLLIGLFWMHLALDTRPVLRKTVVPAILVIAVSALFLAPEWDRSVMTSGAYLRAPLYVDAGAAPSAGTIRERMQQRIVFYKEGHADVTTVVDRPSGRRDLIVNGKPDAYSSAATQDWLGQLPLLLRPDARDVLLIGLGSGSTLAAVESHDNVRAIDVVELSPGVVEAARRHFSEFTGNALDDPRASLLIGDGRLHLEYAGKGYDVVISQPSNPWMAGAAALFTEESFLAMKARLNEGGIACIWFQGFSMPVGNFRMLARTWAQTFEHTSIWQSPAIGEYLFIGSDRALEIDYLQLRNKLSSRKVSESVLRMGIPSVAHVLSYFVTEDAGVNAISGAGLTNTDDNARIEFDTLRGMGRDHTGEILRILQAQRIDPWTYVQGDRDDPEFARSRKLGRELLRDKALFIAALDSDNDARRRILRGMLKRNPYDSIAATTLRQLEELATK